MNRFQQKTITKAVATITAYEEGTIAHICLNEVEKAFIKRMAKKSDDYELTESQNHKLNAIVGKI